MWTPRSTPLLRDFEGVVSGTKTFGSGKSDAGKRNEGLD